MRDDWKLAATSQNSFTWKTLNLFFYLKSVVRVLLLAHSQRIRRNCAHTRQRHTYRHSGMPRLAVSSFTVHAWPRQHFHPSRSRLPLLTFPVAFFLVAASRGRGDSTRAFGWLQKTFSIRFFANCSSRILSLSMPSLSSLRMTNMRTCWQHVAHTPRGTRCVAFGLPSPLFSLPQSQMNILKKEKKLHCSLDEIYFSLLHILWVIFGWNSLCTYAFANIPTTTHGVPWQTF